MSQIDLEIKNLRQKSCRIAVTGVLCALVCQVLSVAQNGFFAIICCIVLLLVFDGKSEQHLADRVLGVGFGLFCGFFLAALFIRDPLVLFLLISVLVGINGYYIALKQHVLGHLMCALFASVVLVVALNHPDGIGELAAAFFIQALIGVSLTLVILALWPIRNSAIKKPEIKTHQSAKLDAKISATKGFFLLPIVYFMSWGLGLAGESIWLIQCVIAALLISISPNRKIALDKCFQRGLGASGGLIISYVFLLIYWPVQSLIFFLLFLFLILFFASYFYFKDSKNSYAYLQAALMFVLALLLGNFSSDSIEIGLVRIVAVLFGGGTALVLNEIFYLLGGRLKNAN